jgi:hypothetical protein
MSLIEENYQKVEIAGYVGYWILDIWNLELGTRNWEFDIRS